MSILTGVIRQIPFCFTALIFFLSSRLILTVINVSIILNQFTSFYKSMDFFALTSYGFSSPIKDMIRSDYKEPQALPNNPLEAVSKIEQSLSERIKELDCYIGHADGYAYRSAERLSKSRRKYVIKPDGPIDMYNYPGTMSMQVGWWESDPILKATDWYKTRESHPYISSEMSRYVQTCMKKDKAFRQ